MQVIFYSLRTYFFPLIPPVIDQYDTFYDQSHLIHGNPCSTLLHLFFHMPSNRFVDGTIDSHPLSLTEDRPWRTWLLKGMRELLDWFNICSAQNTPMTNSESKYNPFVACTTFCTQIIRHLASKIGFDMP